jgi:16S rRNA (guanine966-N2)-methyltransferase
MRVISGIARGTKLNSIESNSTRPTLDRVKEAFFSSIQSSINENIVVLDLFAGSGQIGIEFLSRGVKKVYFCEKNPLAVKMIKQNLEKTKFCEHSIIINKDYKVALENFKKSNIYFDIIYIDPPYKLDMAVKSIDYILNNNLLSKDGVIIIETDEEERELEELKNIDVNIYNIKRYGRVKLIFLRRKE